MENNFNANLKRLAEKYTQHEIAVKTKFSQSSINNYLSGSSEPSIKFLIALKHAFGINIDEFLFGVIDKKQEISYDRFVGSYIIYYYNNTSYKGEVHNNLKNTLSYGIISILQEKEADNKVYSFATFTKTKEDALKILKMFNTFKTAKQFLEFSETDNLYQGNFFTSNQNIFIYLQNKKIEDACFIILNNPPATSNYIGGLGTINSVTGGREHNPCAQLVIMSKKLIDKPDGELYDCLNLDETNVNLSKTNSELIDLFKRLYLQKNELSLNLTDVQKEAILENSLQYKFGEIVNANMFRFAKISNREDDALFKLLREGIDVK